MQRELRVGLLVLVTLAVLGAGVLLIGQQRNLFVRTNDYFIRFTTVSGLKPGNPVQLNGVEVGKVTKVILPVEPTQAEIVVWISLDRSYAHRLRAPEYGVPDRAPATKARIQTLGLLGDKYVELNSGAESYPEIPPDGRIPTAAPSNVDALLASGEDVMGNVVEITHSLSVILGRTERGQGLLGELTTDSESSRQLRQALLATAGSLQRASDQLEKGSGPLPRLLNDSQLGDRLAAAVNRLDELTSQATHGPGLLPGLLNDPGERARFDETMASLSGAARDLKAFTAELNSGQGLVPRLMNDRAYAEEVTAKLRNVVERLSSVADKLDNGPGTASRLINDPAIYQAVNDVVVGVGQSPMLRWLIRNRQKAGIKKRYEDAQGGDAGGDRSKPAPAPPQPAPAPPPPAPPPPPPAPAPAPPPG